MDLLRQFLDELLRDVFSIFTSITQIFHSFLAGFCGVGSGEWINTEWAPENSSSTITFSSCDLLFQ